MRLFGLIGYPLSHSFSKKYFTEKFIIEGLNDCSYELFPIDSIHKLIDVVADHPDLRGLNITVPYKQKVLSYLSQSNVSETLQACNCIKIAGNKLIGYNTDVIGFEKSLLPLLQKHHDKALILGNGGAAAAVQFVLKKLNIHFKTVSRNLHAGSMLTYNELTIDILSTHKLIINTTPVGTYPGTNECPAVPYNGISGQHLLYDLVYNPSKTKFLSEGEKRGAQISNGYKMLIIQAEESWKIWNEIS